MHDDLLPAILAATFFIGLSTAICMSARASAESLTEVIVNLVTLGNVAAPFLLASLLVLATALTGLLGVNSPFVTLGGLMLKSVWFFFPAFVGNQAAGWAVKWNLPLARKVVDKATLGANKTWAQLYAIPAAIVGVYAASLIPSPFAYRSPDLYVLGILFGAGVMLGDWVKSFFKRRRNVKPGERWWPLDEIDYVLMGAFFLASVGELRLENSPLLIAYVLLVILLAGTVKRIGHLLGVRSVEEPLL